MGSLEWKQMREMSAAEGLPPPHATAPPGPSPAAELPLPAGWLRFEAGWLSGDQTLRNLELIVSLLQKAFDGLNGIDELVGDMMNAVNAALVHGDLEQPPPPELMGYVRVRLNQINEIVRQSRFHGRGLLDGQCGVVGLGHGVEFVRGGPNTVTSPPEGYAVEVQVLPRRAWLMGAVSLTEDWLAAERELFIAEGESHVRIRPQPGERVPDFLERLQEALQVAGLELEVGQTGQGRLLVHHHQYGSQSKFKGCSYTTPLLSRRPGKVEWCRRGRDIQGTLAGEPAFGIGRMLVGFLDNARTSELAVLWQGGRPGRPGGGRVHVVQNGLSFQDGEPLTRPPVRISLPSFHTRHSGRWLETPSGFGSLDDIRMESWQELRDTLHLLFAVSCELDDWKSNLTRWIRRYQNQALACLRRTDSVDAGGVTEDPLSAERAEAMARELRALMQQRGA